jgi:hypothetical protein
VNNNNRVFVSFPARNKIGYLFHPSPSPESCLTVCACVFLRLLLYFLQLTAWESSQDLCIQIVYNIYMCGWVCVGTGDIRICPASAPPSLALLQLPGPDIAWLLSAEWTHQVLPFMRVRSLYNLGGYEHIASLAAIAWPRYCLAAVGRVDPSGFAIHACSFTLQPRRVRAYPSTLSRYPPRGTKVHRMTIRTHTLHCWLVGW